MSFDLDQIGRLVNLLAGSPDAVVTWQTIYDPDGAPPRPDLHSHFNGRLSENVDHLTRMQSEHCGVFICLNETDGLGRKDENITHYRALFADFDNQVQPSWPVTPHMISQRDELHGHAFWLVSDIEDGEQFSRLQKRIALCCQTDQQVLDPSRVVRVPGSQHFKNPLSPQRYIITRDNSNMPEYSVKDIERGFLLDATSDAKYTQWVERQKGIKEGTGYASNPMYEAQFATWVTTKAPPAVTGSGSNTVFRVAARAHDLGIPLATSQEMMWELYNPRCEPPWAEYEKRDFTLTVERGYMYATSAAGCKTVSAIFKAAGEVPEPVGGWEANRAINDAPVVTLEGAKVAITNGIRLSEAEAEAIMLKLNPKIPHFSLARAFDGIIYQGCKIIRHHKIFYVFDGKCWGVVSDDVIKSKIQRFLAELEPSDSVTQGVYKCFCDLTVVTDATPGQWLNDDQRDPSNMVVFNNGILDLNGERPELIPHDLNLFTFNKVDYDYAPSVACPTWLQFLNDVWGDDEAMKAQLQEWFGYCLTSDTRHQKFALLMGISRGGKGVITDTLASMVGKSNTVSPGLNKLTADSTLHGMSTKSVAFIPDAHSVHMNNRDAVLSNFKAITGGDELSYHVMYKGERSSLIPTRITMSTNNVPEFVDSSGALVNRMLVFLFENSFQGREDIDLRAKVQLELAGVCNWALEGLQRLRVNNRFTESERGNVEKQELKSDMFPLATFVSDCCDLDPNAVTELRVLHDGYALWCAGTGRQNRFDENKFAKILRTSDLNVKLTRLTRNGKKVRFFSGVKLTAEMTNKLSPANVRTFPAAAAV